MIPALKARFEELRLIDAADIEANWTAITPEFAHPARLIKIVNLTNADLVFTTDTQKVFGEILVPAQTSDIYDISTNQFTTNISGILALPVATMLYVKQVEVPTLKYVAVSVMYGSEL